MFFSYSSKDGGKYGSYGYESSVYISGCKTLV